jgi:hypothetical protein
VAGRLLKAQLSLSRDCRDGNVSALLREVWRGCASVVANKERRMARHRARMWADSNSKVVLSDPDTVQQRMAKVCVTGPGKPRRRRSQYLGQG